MDVKSFYPNIEDKPKDVACGEHHSLLLTSSGSLYAAGLAVYAGIVVYGSNEISYFNKLTKVPTVKNIAVGLDHSIVVTTKGQVYG